jgi:hypothetical protein
MKTLVALLIGSVLALTAYPAAAYVVAVTTSIPAQSVADDDDFDAALKSAIDDVLQHVVAFSPTFITVESARAVGGRVYILLVIGDDEGAATLNALSEKPRAPVAPEAQEERL